MCWRDCGIQHCTKNYNNENIKLQLTDVSGPGGQYVKGAKRQD